MPDKKVSSSILSESLKSEYFSGIANISSTGAYHSDGFAADDEVDNISFAASRQSDEKIQTLIQEIEHDLRDMHQK
jgi:hypothetical protein